MLLFGKIHCDRNVSWFSPRSSYLSPCSTHFECTPILFPDLHLRTAGSCRLFHPARWHYRQVRRILTSQARPMTFYGMDICPDWQIVRTMALCEHTQRGSVLGSHCPQHVKGHVVQIFCRRRAVLYFLQLWLLQGPTDDVQICVNAEPEKLSTESFES